MQIRRLYLFLCLFCCAYLFALNGNEGLENSFSSEQTEQQENSQEQPPLKLSLVAEDSSVQHDRPFWLALRMELQDHWHSYWKNPGDTGMPLNIEWNLPKGYTVTNFKWPTPKKFDKDGMIGFGYEKDAIFLVEITPPQKNKNPSKELPISGQARWLACSDSFCVPGDSEIAINLPVGEKEVNEDNKALFTNSRQALPFTAVSYEAKKSNGLIELEIEVDCTEKNCFSSAVFFPEQRKVINSQDGVLLTNQGDGKYHLLLKEHTSHQASHLKGLVELSSDEKTHLIEIDLPISSDTNEHLIAEANKEAGDKAASEENLVSVSLNDDPDMEFEGGIAMALFFAFIGGALLNLMPCVLPVISFKVLSFVKMAGQSRKETFKHGAAFSIGVIVSFWLFAGAMLLLQSYGKAVGWGFQLQEPAFVACLAALLFVFALSLFGVFEIGVSVTGMAGNAEQNSAKMSALASSFFSGILATALATPCTGPFLGSAIGFAVTLPPLQALLIFTVLGIGMAAPYLLLSAFPSLLRFLPKPGNWMVTFKELMGFVMLATILWLIWVFSAQTGSLATVILLMSFFLFSIAGWIYGRYCTLISSKRTRVVGGFIALLFGAAACVTLMAATSPLLVEDDSGALAANESASPSARWQLFTPKRLQDIHEAKQPVFIDFTAKWCLICQANHLVLSTEEVQQKFSEKNVVTMKADWTKNDPEITKLLRKYGRNGVPLYILFSGDPSKPPQILPQVLTPESVIEAINNM